MKEKHKTFQKIPVRRVWPDDRSVVHYYPGIPSGSFGFIMEQKEIIEGNKLIAEFLGLDLKYPYKDSGKTDDNGVPILEGSIISANGYKSSIKDKYLHVVAFDEDEGQFGSDIYSDFEPLSRYQTIQVVGHVKDYGHLFSEQDGWSGNLGEYNPDIKPKYDSSWEWLMPVIDKIEGGEIGCQGYVNITGFKIDTYCSGYLERGLTVFHKEFSGKRFSGQERIETAWQCVVEFIKWYNTIK